MDLFSYVASKEITIMESYLRKRYVHETIQGVEGIVLSDEKLFVYDSLPTIMNPMLRTSSDKLNTSFLFVLTGVQINPFTGEERPQTVTASVPIVENGRLTPEYFASIELANLLEEFATSSDNFVNTSTRAQEGIYAMLVEAQTWQAVSDYATRLRKSLLEEIGVTSPDYYTGYNLMKESKIESSIVSARALTKLATDDFKNSDMLRGISTLVNTLVTGTDMDVNANLASCISLLEPAISTYSERGMLKILQHLQSINDIEYTDSENPVNFRIDTFKASKAMLEFILEQERLKSKLVFIRRSLMTKFSGIPPNKWTEIYPKIWLMHK